ncbi:hypothetical protein [Streptomyces sp. NPDC002738]
MRDEVEVVVAGGDESSLGCSGDVPIGLAVVESADPDEVAAAEVVASFGEGLPRSGAGRRATPFNGVEFVVGEGAGRSRCLMDRPFNQHAALEVGAGPDQRNEMGCVDRQAPERSDHLKDHFVRNSKPTARDVIPFSSFFRWRRESILGTEE